MSRPHPTDPGFAGAYSRVWTSDPEALLDYFAPDSSYTERSASGTSIGTGVALGATYAGRAEIGRFHRFMLTFAPDSYIDFGDTHAADGRLTDHRDFWDLATVLHQLGVHVG